MTIRTWTAAAAVTLAAALAGAVVPAGGARTDQQSPRVCAAVGAAGAKWSLLSSGVDCGVASGIVRRLARTKVPPGRVWKQPFSGLRCFGGPRAGALPHAIVCGNTNPKRGFTALKSG